MFGLIYTTGAPMDGKVPCAISVSPTLAVNTDPVMARPGAVNVT